MQLFISIKKINSFAKETNDIIKESTTTGNNDKIINQYYYNILLGKRTCSN